MVRGPFPRNPGNPGMGSFFSFFVTGAVLQASETPAELEKSKMARNGSRKKISGHLRLQSPPKFRPEANGTGPGAQNTHKKIKI